MADTKISALPSASLPLAGTEVVPLVQTATTKKVAVDDLTVKNIRSNATTGILQVAGPTAGQTRVMTTPDANFTAARTDAAQTFTGNQTFNNNVTALGAFQSYSLAYQGFASGTTYTVAASVPTTSQWLLTIREDSGANSVQANSMYLIGYVGTGSLVTTIAAAAWFTVTTSGTNINISQATGGAKFASVQIMRLC